MNSQPYNYNQPRSDFSSPNRGNYRGRRNYTNTPPNWRSPPWAPRHNSGGSNSGMKNNYRMMPHHNYNSPRNNMYPYTPQNSSYPSTPGSHVSSYGSDNSGFIPLPFSPPGDRFRSPPQRRGGNWSRGRRSNSFQEQQNCPVEMYYKKSMLEDPWREFNINHASSSENKQIENAS